MLVTICSDIHFNAYKPFATYEDGENSRLLEIVMSFGLMVESAVESGCKILLVPGDLFHTRGALRPSVFNRVVELLSEAAKHLTIVIIPGNHDMENYKGGATAVDSLEMINNVYVIRKPGTFTVRGITILGIPYVHNHKDFLEIMAATVAECEEFDCVMIHQGVYDFAHAGMPTFGVTVKTLSAITEKPIFAGHYHTPRKAENILIPGSMVMHTFGDENINRGYWIWNTEEKNDFKLMPIAGPKFVTITTKKQASQLDSGCYVRTVAATVATAAKMREAATEAGAKGTVARVDKKFTTAHEQSLSLAGPKEMMVEYLNVLPEYEGKTGILLELFGEICEGEAQ